MLSVTLRCEQCDWQTTCGQEQVETRLRKLGLLRRAPNPPEELVQELLDLHLSRLTCDACGKAGLSLADTEEQDSDWQQAIVCEVCRKPIPPERLEAIPNATRCVGCQDAEDRGEAAVEFDYCPTCGAILELKVSRTGGITRYKQFCTGNPSCRL